MNLAISPPVQGTVYCVEEDAATRDALAGFLSSTGMQVRSFGSADEFLSQYSPEGAGCVLLDERLPGVSGSVLLHRIHSAGVDLPTIVVAAYATTPFTVDALRHGATAVLDKPCSETTLRQAIDEALELDELRRQRIASAAPAKRRLAGLSESERRVLELVLQGAPNKQIAERLDVSMRTIEARRSRIYEATGVRSVPELVRLCIAAGFIDA